jgi:hypothetical protein
MNKEFPMKKERQMEVCLFIFAKFQSRWTRNFQWRSERQMEVCLFILQTFKAPSPPGRGWGWAGRGFIPIAIGTLRIHKEPACRQAGIQHLTRKLQWRSERQMEVCLSLFVNFYMVEKYLERVSQHSSQIVKSFLFTAGWRLHLKKEFHFNFFPFLNFQHVFNIVMHKDSSGNQVFTWFEPYGKTTILIAVI